jgi:hypothetical protein
MEKPAGRVKKVAKRSLLNTGKPTEQAEKRVPAIPISISTNLRDKEGLVDYEPEDPPCFLPHGDDVSEPDDSPRTPVPGQADSSFPDYEFGGEAADDAPMAGQKRRPNSPEDELRRKAPKDELAASLRRSDKSIPLFKDDIIVANPPGTAPGEVSPHQTKTNRQPLSGEVVRPSLFSKTISCPIYGGPLRGEVSPCLTKANRQPLLGRAVSPLFLVKRDDNLANLPISTLEGSKSNEYLDGWSVVAIRGTGNAPGSSDGHNPRSSLPFGDKVPVRNNLIRKVVILRNTRHQTKRIRRRSNARVHSSSRRLVFRRATVLEPTPLRHMNRSARGRHFITAATACSAQASRRPYRTFTQGGPPTCERKPLRPTSRIIRYTGLRWVRKKISG